MSSPTNTTEEARKTGATWPFMPGSIEAQEKQGQTEFVNNTVLPTKGLEKFRATIELNGGNIGNPVEGDPIFTHAKLPEGWKRAATDHDMWSRILDDQGRIRARVFYKAAHYDRSAHIIPSTRLSIDQYSHSNNGEWKAAVIDGDGAIVFMTNAVKEDAEKPWQATDQVTAEASDWLQENYPDWESVDAYWDADIPQLNLPAAETVCEETPTPQTKAPEEPNEKPGKVILEVINPADPYTMEASSFEVGAMTAFLISPSLGVRSLMPGDDRQSPILYGWFEWIKERGIDRDWVESHADEMAEALESFVIGDLETREQFTKEAAETPMNFEKFRLAFHEERRTSLSNLGLAAWQSAKAYRQGLAEIQRQSQPQPEPPPEG